MMHDNPDALRMFRFCGEHNLPVAVHIDYEFDNGSTYPRPNWWYSKEQYPSGKVVPGGKVVSMLREYPNLKEAAVKVGLVGLDTSHVVAFAKLLGATEDEFYVPGAQVVVAYPGGSELFSLSRDRVEGFTAELERDFGVRMCETIEAVVEEVDAILLESVDGRQHLDQFRRMAVGKPVYIDKPFAVTAPDAREMIALAEETRTPIMSCSSLRYAAGIADLAEPGESVLSCEAFGPAPILKDYPGLFWYGIHSAEMLFAFMGAGCKRVQCVPSRYVDVVIGEWQDERLGVMRGTRFEKSAFGCTVHTDGGTRTGLARATPPYYYCLLTEVMKFFETGISPIPIEETFEIISFIEAANLSREQGGSIVRTESL